MSIDIIQFGLAATVMALGTSAVAIFTAYTSLHLNRPAMMAVARQAMYVNFALITFACFSILWSLATLDLSVLYVASNANKDLPLIYRISALWGAHEGSLMLWLWLLVGYSALAAYLHRYTHPRSLPHVVITLGLLQVGFLSYILFLSSPFTRIFPVPTEGGELNPLLQDPGLIFHPPMLYMGYVGFSIPFAFAIAALIRGQAGDEWVAAIRRWTLVAWTALTSGIMLGGYWAYYELGWGGYWNWDPVENASLIPWLTGTAFLHSIMAVGRRGLFRTWCVFLILTTFSLSLLGTFLVRSGVLSSVHSFAVDPSHGNYILGFLIVVVIGSFSLLIMRGDRLRSPNHIESLISREAALVLNNIFLLTAALVVFFGTLYPLFAEMISGDLITIAAPFYNLIVLPLIILVIALMAIGPIIPWQRANGQLLARQFKFPLIFAAISVTAAIFMEITHVVGLLGVAAVGLAIASTVLEIGRAARARARIVGESSWISLIHLVIANRRRHGGLLVHIGVLIVTIGVIASGTLGQNSTVAMSPGDQLESGQYTITFVGIKDVTGPNFRAREATLSINVDGRKVGVLKPQRRHYPRSNIVTTEAGIRSTFFEDLYLVLGQEQKNGGAAIQVFRNPLVSWIWIGWLVIFSGALLSITQTRANINVQFKSTFRTVSGKVEHA